MKVAAIQLNPQDNKEENILSALQYVREAANNGAEFIVLPEYVDFMGEESKKVMLGETIPGPTSNAFASVAKEYNIYLLCGSILEKADDKRVYNSSMLINGNGEIIATYRKLHLYDAIFEGRYTIKESDTIKPGKDVVTADTDFGTVGMTICYDIRFPELFRSLALRGSKVIFVPAAFPLYTGAHHWEILLRARAIENQCYIVAAGQFGIAPPDHVEFGNSMIIDPWGTVLARAPEKEAIIIENLDLGYIDQVRGKIPCFNHRRPSVYSKLITNESLQRHVEG
ncbi:carbon-nitrogen hydrolase family protein [Pseudogracilibacillus sp. SO30301A]|uniref:carbon-nitrogen hydrolase family protein n=1 Tax=Pseudogracilibacillus sp. SO30301A TaxID=3098291 RepID=UPI00300E1A64